MATAEQATKSATGELDLVLACVRAFLDPRGEAGVAAIAAGPIDWDRLFGLAKAHRVRPLVARGVGALPTGIVPSEVRDRCQQLGYAILKKNLLLTLELERLLAALDGAGVEAVPIKGPVLASQLYGQLAWREFEDLDLLVRRQDAPAAADVLRSHDYRLAAGGARALELRSEYHYPFHHAGGQGAVELHCELMPWYFGFPVRTVDLWGRLEWVPLRDTRVRALPAEDTLLFLCAHGAKHLWRRLCWIADVAALLGGEPALDWERTVSRAEELGARRILATGLRVAACVLGGAAGARAVPALGDAQTDALVEEIRIGLRAGEPSPPGAAAKARFHIRIRERRRDRLRYGLLLLLAPNWDEIEFLSLPRVLFPLYWIIRPLRLLARYGPEAARLIWERCRPGGGKRA